MTNERAKSELMQIYGMLSEEKKKALDVAFKAMEKADRGFNEWCHDCKEYDQEKHCCPRFNRVIRETVAEIQADGEYIPRKMVLETIDKWYEDKADIEDLIVKITYMPSVAIPNKTEIEAILQRFYNEEISCADMVQEMMNLGFVIER